MKVRATRKSTGFQNIKVTLLIEDREELEALERHYEGMTTYGYVRGSDGDITDRQGEILECIVDSIYDAASAANGEDE